MKLVLTCEHGGYLIPKTYEPYFKDQEVILHSHRGFDLGALDAFLSLKPLSDFSKFSKISRLLIELNRSLHHGQLFSEFSKLLSKAEKTELINNYYFEYRRDVESAIKKRIDTGETVVHISVHSFTPILNSIKRDCDIGLLYDSKKTNEKSFCKLLKEELLSLNPNLKVRYNYPYLGKSDGFTTFLRKRFPENYIGIEMEINQKFSNKNKIQKALKKTLFEALKNGFHLYDENKIN